jgi:hypothetical protein
MRRTALFMTPLALGAWLSGCSDRDADIGVRRSVLRAFQSCGELETYLEDAALDQIGRSYYWGWGFGRGGVDDALAGGPQEDGAPPSDPTSGPTGGLTGTNNQEANVDEADFVKSDDRFIYVLHGENLVILNAFPAAGASIVSQTELDSWPWQMFVSGDLALVLGDAPAQTAGPFPEGGYWTPRVRATVLDLGADRTAPTVVRQSDLDGFVVGARLVGRSARVVTAHYTPIEIDWNVTPAQAAPEPPNCGWDDGVSTEPGEPPRIEGWAAEDCDAEWERYYREAEDYQEAYLDAVRDHNRDAIRALTLDDLLPQVETRVGDDVESDAISQCTSFYRTEVESGYGLVSVSTFDLDHPTDELDATTIVGDYGLLYASEDQLYVAMAEYPDWNGGMPDPGTPMQITAVHQFDIGSDPRGAAYVASGEVPGRLNNSFSMDEHDGYLRIATTIDRATSDWSMDRDNSFTVLAPNEGLLEVVGQINAIAAGEQIYAARMFDEEGYLVTFRTIDPLFALDLRDPAAPRITGELEIPGFSQYMHPLGPDHLLTIGTAADEGGAILGLQLSIFDVSDPAAPALAFPPQSLGSGYSEAQYDHKAFTFKTTSDAGDEGILGIPVTNWETGDGAELLVFDVSAASGFVGLGGVSHSDLFTDPADAYCYLRDVRRSVMSDDHVYSISYAGFKVNPLDDLTQTTASGVFEQTDLCGYVEAGEGDVGVGVEGGP